MDPLTRGSIFHDIQARFFRELRVARRAAGDGAEPRRRRAGARRHDRRGGGARARRAGAGRRARVGRRSGVDPARPARLAALRRRRTATSGMPSDFEYRVRPRARRARCRAAAANAVTIEGGFRLRGAIDLIEEHRQIEACCASPTTRPAAGPIASRRSSSAAAPCCSRCSMAMAVEAALGARVSHGRLFYCTSAGSFVEHPIPLNDTTRARGLEVLQRHRPRHRDRVPRRRAGRGRVRPLRLPPACAAPTCGAGCSASRRTSLPTCWS